MGKVEEQIPKHSVQAWGHRQLCGVPPASCLSYRFIVCPSEASGILQTRWAQSTESKVQSIGNGGDGGGEGELWPLRWKEAKW